MFKAALGEFSRLGFHQASVDEIALKAGVSKATLYNHFETKEALFLAVFDQVLSKTIKPPEFDLRNASLEDEVKHGIRNLFKHVAGTPEARFFFHCMTSDSNLLTEALRKELSDRFISTCLGEMKEFERAQKDGKVNPNLDLEITHHAIMGMILQALRFWWSREKAIPVNKLADQLSEFISYGLTGRRNKPSKTGTGKSSSSKAGRRKLK